MSASEVRWWDGQCWGPTPREARDAGWWLASDGRYYPVDLASEPVPGPLPIQPPAPPKRFYTRWWFWVLAIVVGVPVAGYGLLAISVLGQSPEAVNLEDFYFTYVEDFNTGDSIFDIRAGPEDGAAVVDGAYVMANRGISSDPAARSGVNMPWTATGSVRIEAQVELTAGGELAEFGLYLDREDGRDYVFSVSPAQGAAIIGPGIECRESSPSVNYRGGGIALSGEHRGNRMILTGYLDREVVVTCVDDLSDAYWSHGLTEAGLWLHADGEPATLQVDAVTVTAFRH